MMCITMQNKMCIFMLLKTEEYKWFETLKIILKLQYIIWKY